MLTWFLGIRDFAKGLLGSCLKSECCQGKVSMNAISVMRLLAWESESKRRCNSIRQARNASQSWKM